MDWQTVTALALAAIAGILVLRHVWEQVKGLFRPDQAGCPGCGECDAAKADASRQPKVTPLVTIRPRRPADRGRRL